jgi:hypothetical protein
LKIRDKTNRFDSDTHRGSPHIAVSLLRKTPMQQEKDMENINLGSC